MPSRSSDMSVPGERSLSESINVATRPLHARLNKRIVGHLPQALPPRATDPSAYVTGLLHIAPIYATFESLWHEILTVAPHCAEPRGLLSTDGTINPEQLHCTNRARPLPSCVSKNTECEGGRNDGPLLPGHVPHVCDRMHYILGVLHLPGLLRDSRLRRDIEAMTGWSRTTVDEQIADVGLRGPLGSFLEHIKKAIQDKPHVLVAYSYILYMALFAGGRFMRASLESAGEEYWSQVPSPVRPNLLPCTNPETDACTYLKDDVNWEPEEGESSSNQSSHLSSVSSPRSISSSRRMAAMAEKNKVEQGQEKQGTKAPATATTTTKTTVTCCKTCHPEVSDPCPHDDIACPTRQHANPHISLHFFHFPTAEDGEDLKREFKERLAAMECRLSERECADVVGEGVQIFEHMLMVVEQLDQICNPTPLTSDSDEVSAENLLRLGRLRDSVVVARERNAKKSMERLRNSPVSGSEAGKMRGGAAAAAAVDDEDGRTIRFDMTPPPAAGPKGKGKGKERANVCYDGVVDPYAATSRNQKKVMMVGISAVPSWINYIVLGVCGSAMAAILVLSRIGASWKHIA